MNKSLQNQFFLNFTQYKFMKSSRSGKVSDFGKKAISSLTLGERVLLSQNLLLQAFVVVISAWSSTFLFSYFSSAQTSFKTLKNLSDLSLMLQSQSFRQVIVLANSKARGKNSLEISTCRVLYSTQTVFV